MKLRNLDHTSVLNQGFFPAILWIFCGSSFNFKAQSYFTLFSMQRIFSFGLDWDPVSLLFPSSTAVICPGVASIIQETHHSGYQDSIRLYFDFSIDQDLGVYLYPLLPFIRKLDSRSRSYINTFGATPSFLILLTKVDLAKSLENPPGENIQKLSRILYCQLQCRLHVGSYYQGTRQKDSIYYNTICWWETTYFFLFTPQTALKNSLKCV